MIKRNKKILIVQCSHVDASNIVLMTLAELGIWLQKTTSKEIEAAITVLILELQDTQNLENMCRSDIMEAVEMQRDIGIYPFVCGISSMK